jgi:hypothetical protein
MTGDAFVQAYLLLSHHSNRKHVSELDSHVPLPGMAIGMTASILDLVGQA